MLTPLQERVVSDIYRVKVLGALGVELAGDASYFGKVHHKPTLGDPLRPVEAEDIPRAGRLMLLTAGVCCLLATGLRWGLWMFWMR